MSRIPFSIPSLSRAIWSWIGGAAGTTADRAVNATFWNGSAVAAPDTAGYPKVTVKDGTGTGEIDLTAGKVDINDKTGFTLTAGSYAVWKSVQYGTYTFTSGGVSVTATLGASVNTAKAVIIPLGFAINKGSTVGVFNLPYLAFSAVNQVTATRLEGQDSAGSNVTGTGTFVVVEAF